MNTEAICNQDEALSIGIRLRKAREQRGLSQQDVAERLCLKVSTIRDIEEDKPPINLASTFLRGYIRSYAKLVNIPEKELLLEMKKESLLGKENISPMRSLSLDGDRKNFDGWLVILTWLLLFIIIGLTGFWWWKNHIISKESVVTINNYPIEDSSSSKLHDTENNQTHSDSINTNNVLAGRKMQGMNKTISLASVESLQLTMSAIRPSTQIPGQNNTDYEVNILSQATINMVLIPAMISHRNLDINCIVISTDQVGTTAPVSSKLVTDYTANYWIKITDFLSKKLFSSLYQERACYVQNA